MSLICNAFNGYTGGADDNDAQGRHLVAHTLQKRHDGSEEGEYAQIRKNAVDAIAFTERTREQGRTLEAQEELAYAVADHSSGGSTHGKHIAYAISENQRAETRLTPYSRQITSGGGKPGQGYPAALTRYGVRRLTPIECERLQGFEDEHTAWGLDGNGERVEMSDSARYRMLGNAVCCPVALWLGRRIVELEKCQGDL